MKRYIFAVICVSAMVTSVVFSKDMKTKKKKSVVSKHNIDKKDLKLRMKGKRTKKRVCVVFAHGFGGSGESRSRKYIDAGMFPNCRVAYVEFPDSPNAKGNNGRVNSSKTCFGQSAEKEMLEDKVEEEQEEYDKVILFGVSRGAIAVLNSDFDDAVGLFVESPASTLEDVAQDQCKQYGFGWIPGLGKVIHEWVFPWLFRSYDPKGDTPIANSAYVPHNVPVFIAYTKNDNLIPASSSVRLAEELIRNGHPEVYLYGSDEGKHGNMLNKEYAHVTHAFLQRCGALDDDYCCEGGQALLAQCRILSVEHVQKIREEVEWLSWRSYLGRNLAVLSAIVTGGAFLVKKVINFVGDNKEA